MELKHLDVGFEIKSVSEDGTFTGYGSVFGVVDSYFDVVAPGAFAESLAAHAAKGTMPAMLYQHDTRALIGVYTSMKEDSVGLYVEGQLALKTALGSDAYELMKIKALTGLSIGYVTREDNYDRATGIRTLKKVDVWEVSPVTFPSNDSSRVASVKSQIAEIKTIRDAEAWLRDAAKLSRSQAGAVLAQFKAVCLRDAGDEQALTAAKSFLAKLQS